MIYKAKAYKNSSRINLAIEVLNEIVEKFSKKNETSEAYYMLASLSLFNDFDLEQSEEYFDKSIDEKSRSDYAKKSKLLPEIFHSDVLDHYIHAAEWELKDYDISVNDWQLRRYFERG